MKYQVVFVEDHELPAAHDWVLVKAARVFYAFLRKSRVTAEVLAEAWAAFVRFVSEPDVRALLAEPAVPVLAAPRSA